MPTISTKELAGLAVVDEVKRKRLGKVQHFVFHPEECRVMGFTVRRPDKLLMFKRKDVFVQLKGFDIENGSLVVRDDPAATDKGACEALGIDLDRCVLWIGMPAMTEQGDMLGFIDDVQFDPYTGEVAQAIVATGMAKDALLGRRVIEARYIIGFRRGQGIALAATDGNKGAEDEAHTQRGAIIVDPAALKQVRKGGVAEAAGKASAVVTDKARKGVAAARKSAVQAKGRIEPDAKKAAVSAGEAINKGAYAAGEHVAKIGGMFSAFKEEFVKGMNGEYDDEDE